MAHRDAAGKAHEDPEQAIALVVSDIDDSTSEERDVLLGDLLCAAWPSPAAQAQ